MSITEAITSASLTEAKTSASLTEAVTSAKMSEAVATVYVPESFETPDYSNTGGQGDRESIITVSVDEEATTFWRTFGTYDSVRQNLVDGDTSSTVEYLNNALPVVNRWMEFDFLGEKKLITEARLYNNTSFATCGVWTWQGYDGVTWNDIGSSFTLGVEDGSNGYQTFSTLSGGVIGYYKYRYIGVSGNSSYLLYYWTEFEFKIGALA